MRVLVIGAGPTGAKVIQQLQKNPSIEVITADPRPEPIAVAEGVIEKADIVENITPLTFEAILKEARPDLVLITTQPEDMGLGKTPGVDMLAEALHGEIAALSPVPVIEVAGTG
jgi:threonine dehydrogenase-like Zn-dependent dehydrogenase